MRFNEQINFSTGEILQRLSLASGVSGMEGNACQVATQLLGKYSKNVVCHRAPSRAGFPSETARPRAEIRGCMEMPFETLPAPLKRRTFQSDPTNNN